MNPNQAARKCPICGKPAEAAGASLGPFCSARCQMIDLGQWLGEGYKISEPLRPEHFAAFEDLQAADLDQAEPE